MTEVNFVIAKQIKKFINRDELGGLAIFLGTLEPVAIAEAMKFLTEDEKVMAFKALPARIASEVLGETDEQSQEDIVEELPSKQLGLLLGAMDTDDAVDILDDLEEEDQKRLLDEIERQQLGRANVLRELLQYPEDTAGGIMVPEVLSIQQRRTIGDALKLFKAAVKREQYHDIHNIYVINKRKELKGLLPIRSLIVYPAETKIKSIMEKRVHFARVDEDQEHVANIVRRYDLYAIPVVDMDNKLVGRITADDILDVIDEEAIEDLSHIAGVTEEDFVEESVLRSVRYRVPWLLIGLMGGIISATVLNFFEDALKIILALAFFVPVVTAMGGNAGVQSSAIIVKSLAMGDIHPRFLLSRVLREFRVAFLNGLICSLVLSVIVYFWLDDVMLSFLIGQSLVLVIIIATIVGTVVPLLLKSLNIDPAIAMGPFVTTSNDILGLMIYLSLATLFIHYFR